MKRPRTRALLPQGVARLVGLAALASVGALEWQRLVGDLSSARALVWVAVAVVAAAAVLGAERVPSSRASVLVLPAIVAASLLAGYLLSGAGLDLLRPRHWDELVVGLVDGLQALGTVKLPYVSADPWPRIVLELLGAELLILAGLMTFWPRVPSALELAPALRAAGARLPVRRARGAAGRRRLAGGVARRHPFAGARPRARRAHGGLPVARAAAAQARAGRRRAAGDRARGRAAARSGRRSRPAVVRLSLVRREPRAGRSRALLVGAELRADQVAARRQRGDAHHLRRAPVLEGAQPRHLRQLRLEDAHRPDQRAGRRAGIRPPGGLARPPGVDAHDRGERAPHALAGRDRGGDDRST